MSYKLCLQPCWPPWPRAPKTFQCTRRDFSKAGRQLPIAISMHTVFPKFSRCSSCPALRGLQGNKCLIPLGSLQPTEKQPPKPIKPGLSQASSTDPSKPGAAREKLSWQVKKAKRRTQLSICYPRHCSCAGFPNPVRMHKYPLTSTCCSCSGSAGAVSLTSVCLII